MPNVFLPFFPFVNGTIISADEMNADLAALRDGTLSTTGDTMNGPLVFSPDNLYDIGETVDHRPRSVYIGTKAVAPEFHAQTAIYTPTLSASVNIATVTLAASNAITAPLMTATNATVTDTLNATHMRGFDVVVTGGVSAPNYYGGAFSGDGSALTGVLHAGDATPIITGNWTFSADAGILIENLIPVLRFKELGVPAETGYWRFVADAGVFYLQTLNDAGTASGNVFAVNRTGTVANQFVFGTNSVLFPQGSASAPGLAFAGDVDTGLSAVGNVMTCFLGGNPNVLMRGDFVGGAAGQGAVIVQHATTANYQVVVSSGTASLPSSILIGNNADFSFGGGPHLIIGRNANPTLPAAGHLDFTMLDSQTRAVWVDFAGALRIHTSGPVGNPASSDVAGTIVGTQTSTAAVKDILGLGIAPFEALQKVIDTPVYHFRYLEGFPGEEFDGIVTDDAPHFGMDQGKSLNTVNAIGYLIQAIKALHYEIARLKGEGVVHA